MAKMIPSEVSFNEFHESYGEACVYEALKNLPDEYIVFHSVHWNRKNERGKVIWGESDFTIFNPKRGLIVIEVKSGGIKHSEGRWIQINTITHEKYKMKDPMVQAEKSKYTFIDLITSNDESIHTYWVESAVWFPSIDNYSSIGEMPPAYNEFNVLTKNDLLHPLKSIEKIYDHYRMTERIYYEKIDSDFIVKVLSPKFDAIPSISNDILEQKFFFNRMTREQSYLLDYLEEQRVAAIQGGAGTGKTMLALEKARRLSKDDKVLFLCFNKYLLTYLKNAYSDEITNVDFYNLPSLVCSKMKVGDAGGDEGISAYLNNYDKYSWNYKHIIIDEGQDFYEAHIELLSDIAEINGGCFYIFYDKNQLVQQRQELDWVKYVECRLILSVNCRNTKSIAYTANKTIGIDKVMIRNDVLGQKPNFYITNSKTELICTLSSIIKKYIASGIKKNQIVILTAKTEDSSILAYESSIGNYRIVDSINENGIFFTTARKFKGLESDIIIIIDVDDETFKNEELKRVLYVGTSRAKHRLDFVVFLNKNQIESIGTLLMGQPCKNAKLTISSMLKVKIAINRTGH